MAFTDHIITEQEVNAVHVEAQPTILRGSAQQNKQVFDKYSDLIVEKHNALCTEVAGAVEVVIDPLTLGTYLNLGWIPEN